MHGLAECLGALKYVMAVDSSCILAAGCGLARGSSLADECEADGSSLAAREADRRAALIECVTLASCLPSSDLRSELLWSLAPESSTFSPQ